MTHQTLHKKQVTLNEVMKMSALYCTNTFNNIVTGQAHWNHSPSLDKYYVCGICTMPVVYGDSSVIICGGSWGGSDHCAWPDVTWPEVTSVTCHIRKYVLRMRNRKLRNIRPSGAFLTGSDPVRKWPCPEAVLIGGMFCAWPAFSPAFFFFS